MGMLSWQCDSESGAGLSPTTHASLVLRKQIAAFLAMRSVGLNALSVLWQTSSLAGRIPLSTRRLRLLVMTICLSLSIVGLVYLVIVAFALLTVLDDGRIK